jgi:hypothetical protein
MLQDEQVPTPAQNGTLQTVWYILTKHPFYNYHCIFQIEGSIWNIPQDNSPIMCNISVFINSIGLMKSV